MSEQDDTQATTIQRPATNDREAWKAYWRAEGQEWRTEPEIDEERQKYLTEQRAIVPDIEKGIYPFRNIKLNRADVEWLLATHENGQGPINWSDERQQQREGLDLRGANLRRAKLSGLPLARMRGGLTSQELFRATKELRNMAAAQLQEANLWRAELQKAILTGARLQEASLWEARLQEASLWEAQLQGATLGRAQLQGAYLHRADLEDARLDGVTLSDQIYGSARLADIKWGEVNLAVVDWGHVTRLGDEQVAQQEKDSDGEIKDKQTRVNEYKEAVRANRQLTVVLQDQGLNEEADHFAYRAQLLQRTVWRLQRRPLKFLLSWFLFLLAGYGYRPLRSLIAYLVIIFAFMGLNLLNAHFVAPHLTWDEALVLSVSSFHGRGFFTQNVTLGDTYARLAAVEAIIGLFIEISFIATFTQRFFGK